MHADDDSVEQDPTPHITELLDRLTRVGWIRASRVGPNSLFVDWTDKGKKSAIQLADILDELDEPLSPGELVCLRFLIDYHYRRPGSHFAEYSSEESL